MFKIGDRVWVINETRGSYGHIGTIVREYSEDDDYDWYVLLDKHSSISYHRTLAYLEKDIELDKNTVVIKILNDL